MDRDLSIIAQTSGKIAGDYLASFSGTDDVVDPTLLCDIQAAVYANTLKLVAETEATWGVERAEAVVAADDAAAEAGLDTIKAAFPGGREISTGTAQNTHPNHPGIVQSVYPNVIEGHFPGTEEVAGPPTVPATSSHPSQQAPVPAAAPLPPKPVPVPAPPVQGPVCPKCGGPMWDNRADKKSAKQPDFRCKDRDGCGGVIWPPR